MPSPLRAPALGSGSEPANTAERCRTHHRTPLLCPERERHHAGGHGRRAARRPAGSSAEIARVAGWSGVVVRERSGLDLAHEHLAQRLQSCDNVASALGNPISLHGRAPLGGVSGPVKDILDVVRYAMQRTSWSCLVPYLCQRCGPLPRRFQVKPTLGPERVLRVLGLRLSRLPRPIRASISRSDQGKKPIRRP